MTVRLFLINRWAAIAVLLASSACGEEILPPEYVSDEILVPVPPPHLVIEAPRIPKHHRHAAEETVVYDEAWNASHEQPIAGSQPVKHHEKLHDKVASHFLNADKTPRPVAIPNAIRVPVWKTPYSYGHFGAIRNRQWSFHNGHQQTYSQWTLR